MSYSVGTYSAPKPHLVAQRWVHECDISQGEQELIGSSDQTDLSNPSPMKQTSRCKNEHLWVYDDSICAVEDAHLNKTK